ncbi:hypothetical protein I4U23_019614 [Adineta vaga]|nr:hypothetical protein I4U23_019614 [Adineta vaga]
MQQVHTNREVISDIDPRKGDNSSMIVRTDLSSFLSEYTNSQRRCNDRLQSLEHELAVLKGQVNETFSSSSEHELNQTFTLKKPPTSQQSTRQMKSPSRIPLPITPRRLLNDDKSASPTSNKSLSNPLPAMPLARSKTFHNDNVNELSRSRSHKVQRDLTEQSDIRIPAYSSLEDIIKANEELFFDNDRLRTDLSRLKAENIVLLRSMKASTTIGSESYLGTDRILAERERHELTIELARHMEENKRLRKSLLAQSAKFITLRQSISNTSSPTANEYPRTPRSARQPTPNSSRLSKPKSARYNSNHRELDRENSVYHREHKPS